MQAKIILAALTVLSLASGAFAQTQKTSLTKKKARATANVTRAETSTTSVAKVEKSSDSSNAAMTEYAYQPKEGHVSLTATPQILNESSAVLLRGQERNANDDLRTNLIVLRAERGLIKNLSWSAEVGVGNQEATHANENSSQSKGLTDFTFGIRQLRETVSGQMFYGVNLSLSPADKEMSYAYLGGRSTDGNLFSGGNTLAPYLGVQIDRRDFLFGGTAKLQYFFDRSETGRLQDGRKLTINRSGAHVATLEAFIEKPTRQIAFGAKLNTSVITSSDTDVNAGGSKLGLSTNSYQTLGAGFYAKFSPSPTRSIDVLPSLSLIKSMGGSGGSLSMQEDQEVSFAVSVRAAL